MNKNSAVCAKNVRLPAPRKEVQSVVSSKKVTQKSEKGRSKNVRVPSTRKLVKFEGREYKTH